MRRRRKAGVAALVAAAVAWAGPSSRQVQVLDNCDGPSFNAAIGPGTCIRNGGLSFEQFLGALSRGGAPSWRFSPGELSARPAARSRRLTAVASSIRSLRWPPLAAAALTR
jgi:hypothetical protein